jgi:sn-glycerol 3-phosphate transport system substrate-binding protein
VSTSFLAGKISMMLLSTGSLSVRAREHEAGLWRGLRAEERAQRRADRRRLAGHVQGPERRAEDGRLEVRQWLSSTETLGGWSRFTGYFSPRKSPYDTPR